MANVNTDSIDRGFVLGNKALAEEVFAKHGFLVLSSVTGDEKTAEVNADQIYQGKGGDDSRNQRMATDKPELLPGSIETCSVFKCAILQGFHVGYRHSHSFSSFTNGKIEQKTTG